MTNSNDDSSSNVETSESYTIRGFKQCGYFRRAAKCARQLAEENPGVVSVTVQQIPTNEWLDRVEDVKKTMCSPTDTACREHTSCPLITRGDAQKEEYIGGFTAWKSEIESKFGCECGVKKTTSSGSWKQWIFGK
eukprot:52475_1